MRHPQFLKRALAALIFLMVATLLLWRGLASSSRRTVKFADGRELIIRQLTYGTEHKFVTGSALAKVVAPALPASLKGRMGVQTLVQKTDAPAVVIWGEWRRVGKGNLLAPMLRLKSNGATRDARTAWNWMSIRSGRHPAWGLTNFPRRDSILHLEVC